MGQRETPWSQRDGERLSAICTMERYKYILKRSSSVTNSLHIFFVRVDIKEEAKFLIWPA